MQSRLKTKICTLGPSSYKKKVLIKLKKKGVNIFRINMSHTQIKDLPNKINYLKKNKIKNICIDTEGAQIRTTKVKSRILLKKGKKIILKNQKELSDDRIINLYPSFNLINQKINSKIFLGFNNLVLKIKKKNIKENFLITEVVKSGFLESNKGVHFSNSNLRLSPLTNKDKEAINYAKKAGIKYFAMSFVNESQDVDLLRDLAGKNVKVISKIETNKALKNLNKIIDKSDAILIDRGDLSRYVPIYQIPIAQEYVIKIANKKLTPVYVATNLLETMIEKSEPTRAESHDIYSSLKNGADGLVLAAETAIGKFPVECVDFLNNCIKAYNKSFRI